MATTDKSLNDFIVEKVTRLLGITEKRYNELIFNAGILGFGTVFIQSLFNGNIFYSFLGIMVPLIIVEYYRVKEKFYWRELKSKQQNQSEKEL